MYEELPLERAATIPAAWYRDHDVYEAERRAVFGASWLMVGRREVVEKPGSFLTADVAGEPILVVRDLDGQLHAFANVCRHRAAPLLTAECGSVSRLRCRYHGWTYDLGGQLRGVPEFDGVANFCREENGLVRRAVDTWGPFVWTHASESPPLSLATFLAEPSRWLRDTGLNDLHFVRRCTYDLACNWKVFVDNYLDGGYHVHTVHPGLAGVLDYSGYRIELGPWSSAQISPLKAADDALGRAVEQVRAGANAYYVHVFPNLMLNVYQGYADSNLVLPLGPERCRVVFDYFFAQTDDPGQQQAIEASIAVSHQIQLEDVGICEEVQRGLGSSAFNTGRYSVRREAAVHAFHTQLGRLLLAQPPKSV